MLGIEPLNLAMVVVAFWLVSLTVFLLKLTSNYQRLGKGVEKGNLNTLLEKVLKEQESQGEKIENLFKNLKNLEEKSKSHFQKLGLVRFNPFSETGGDQSFTLTLLDGKNDGITISSLHARENTRIYAKTINDGKALDYKLSREETDALKKAIKE